MRPDKKGNRKRDEKRNGPKSAPQQYAGAQKAAGPGPKRPAAPTEQTGGGSAARPTQPPAARPAPTSAARPVEQPVAAEEGPRVLQPAAPPPSDAARYRRREITSNWHRYEEEPDAEPEVLPDEDFLRGDTFDAVLAASGGDSGHFQLRSERRWLDSASSTCSLLTFDGYRAAAALAKLPLPSRLLIDEKHFTDEELEQFALEARTSAASDCTPAAEARAVQKDGTSGAPANAPASPGEHRTAAGDSCAAADQLVPSATDAAAETSPPADQQRSSSDAAPAPEPTDSKEQPPSAAPEAAPSPAPAAAPVVPDAPAMPALLQDDWLDSVLSDDDD